MYIWIVWTLRQIPQNTADKESKFKLAILPQGYPTPGKN